MTLWRKGELPVGRGPHGARLAGQLCGLVPVVAKDYRTTFAARPRTLPQVFPFSRRAFGGAFLAASKDAGIITSVWRVVVPCVPGAASSLIWAREGAERA